MDTSYASEICAAAALTEVPSKVTRPSPPPSSGGERKETNPKQAFGDKKVPLDAVSVIAKAYLAMAIHLGRTKYGSYNYRYAGVRASTYYAAVQRHLDLWWSGEWLDPDGTPHLANALACITVLIEAHHGNKLTDDRPPATIDLRRVYKEMEVIKQSIADSFGHMKPPRHYTIADTEECRT